MVNCGINVSYEVSSMAFGTMHVLEVRGVFRKYGIFYFEILSCTVAADFRVFAEIFA